MPRILVIDDSLTIRKLVGISLERAGFEVSLASTGNEGLSLAQRLKPDLITLDYRLPDLSAEDILTRLERDPATSEIPVILMSARDDDVRTSMKSSGKAIDFISKPFNAPVIVARVKNGLATVTQQASRKLGSGRRPALAGGGNGVVSNGARSPMSAEEARPSVSPQAAPSQSSSAGASQSAQSLEAAAAPSTPASARPAAGGPSKLPRAFPAWPFSQKEQFARVLFSKLRGKLGLVPSWLPALGENPAGELARRLFTFDTVDSLIDALEPLFHANMQPSTGALAGSTAILGLEPLLNALAEQNKDGEIRLQHDGVDTVLQMTNGVIMLVSTTSASRYLEGIPFDPAKVPPDLMARATAEQARSAKPVLVSLAEEGIKVGDVATLVQRRGLELLRFALQQRCSYTFTPTATAATQVTEFTRPVTLEQIKLEAARESGANLPPGIPAAFAHKTFARVSGFSRRVRRVNLETVERRVASALDGRVSVQALAARAGVPLEQAVATVRALEVVGLAEEIQTHDPARPIHVVLIGERPDFSESLRAGLSQHRALASYRVLSAAEAEEMQEACDLMVVGALDGADTERLLARTRQRFQGAIAVISAHEGSEGHQRWLELGANLVLSKPVHVPTLCSLL